MSDNNLQKARPLPKFDEALQYAYELHKEQTRKGTDTPYIAHLMAVAALVLENGGTAEQAIAALLHDAIEDQGHQTSVNDICHRFGPKVAEIVSHCTDTDEDPKPDWLPRKMEYLAHLPTVPKESRLVSMADKIHNAGSVLEDLKREGLQTLRRFNGRRSGTLWYYDSLARIFCETDPGPMARRLDEIVDQMYVHARVPRPVELVAPSQEQIDSE